MKRVSNTYKNMISYRKILSIFNLVKKNCHNKNKVFEFMKYKNSNILEIMNKLKNNNYVFSNYNIFLIYEKKYRIIMSENIKDKIVNQLVSYNIILPILKCLVNTNVATRKNKGTNYAYKLIDKYLNEIGLDKKIYVLKLDINKYFYNINHSILMDMLKKKIKDKDSLKILEDIIGLTDKDYVNIEIKELINKEINRVNGLNISTFEKEKKIRELRSIPLYKKGKGLSIGCLTNQMLAIFFLNDIDHYIKEELGEKYLIHYMDDYYIFSTDRERLNREFKLIENKLREIDLSINNKSGVFCLRNGVNFLGYTYFVRDKVIVRYNNSNIRKIDRKLKRLYDSDFDYYYRSVASYKGYFIRCNTRMYYKKYKLYELNGIYDKYILIKKRYKDNIVIIKRKKRYYTFNDDLRLINKTLRFKRKSYSKKDFYRIRKKFNNIVLMEENSIKVC